MADDIRQRRAERVKQERARTFFARNRNYLIIAVVVVVAIGVVAAFPSLIPTSQAKKFGHEHEAWGLFVHGEHINFRDPAYDIQAINDKVHMHVGENGGGAIWHEEANFPGGQPDLTLAQILGQYGLTFRQGYLKLDTHDGHNGSEYADSGNNTWHVYVSKVDASGRLPFVEQTGDYSAFVPRDLEKILITYGSPDAATLASQQAAIPEPPGQAPAAMPK